MNKEQLRQELKKFKEKIDRKENMDSEIIENMKNLMSDVENFLENPDSSSDQEKENLVQNLRDSAVNFETKHSELSESINIILHTLSNMGI
jgi:chromosome segregation ATPase